jgi:hypothetical protein
VLAEILDAMPTDSRSGGVVRDAAETKPEAPVTGRLTTAQYIVTLSQLEAQLKAAVEGYQKLPGLSPAQVEATLRGIMDAARAAGAKAEKLLSANR